MIDARFSARLDRLEQERVRLIGNAAGYRLRAFNSIESLAPQAAKADLVLAGLRYAKEHWLLTGTVFALAGLALRRQIGMLGLAQMALGLGSRFLAR